MDFGETLLLLAIVGPIVLMWCFAVIDLFTRHDLSGAWKATWLVIVLIVPFFGSVMYLVAKPREPKSHAPAGTGDPDLKAEQLRVLQDLHERGKLSDEELAHEQAMVGSSVAGWASRTSAPTTPATPPPP